MYGPLPQYERSNDDPNFKKIPPGNVRDFRELPPREPVYIPEIAENRKCTDITFIILFAIFIVGVIAYSAFVFTRPRGYYDYSMAELIAPDFRIKKFILTLVGMTLTAIVLCYLLFVSFWYNTKCTFYILFIIGLVFILIMAIVLWIMAVKLDLAKGYSSAALVTVLAIIMIILAYCFRKRLPLIRAIYEEAFHAMFSVSALLVLPLLTILIFICANIPLGYIIALFLNDPPEMDAAIYVYFVFLSFVTTWCLTFILGSQCIVVAGSVAGYYFTRDKSNLGSPFCTSMCVYIRFHLGTVAAGSLIITILTMLKSFGKKGNDNGMLVLVECCMDTIIEIVEYITKKAYIMTAIHGKNLCTSGKRAARLLWSNLFDTIAVDFVGGGALLGAFLLMILIILGVGIGINYPDVKETYEYTFSSDLNWLWYLLFGLYSGMLVILFFMEMITVTIETVFLCFCEDKIMNNGSRERPYFMSYQLLQTMQKIFEMVDSRRNSLANAPPPPPPPTGQSRR